MRAIRTIAGIGCAAVLAAVCVQPAGVERSAAAAPAPTVASAACGGAPLRALAAERGPAPPSEVPRAVSSNGSWSDPRDGRGALPPFSGLQPARPMRSKAAGAPSVTRCAAIVGRAAPDRCGAPRGPSGVRLPIAGVYSSRERCAQLSVLLL